MIIVDNLSFCYNRGDYVLQNINLKFDRRSTALIGQNGAGKTTFVKLLKGLLKPAAGSIYIMDKNIAGTTAAKLAGTVGLVFQNPNDQIFKKNVWEEVLFGPINIRMEKEKARQNALRALEIAGLEKKTGVNPQDLSLSEKKLLCIASVIAMDTEIIILDEPTMAQDRQGKNRVREILGFLKAKNKLVIAIIHDMDFAAENFERTVVFSEGRVLLDDTTKNVFSDRDILNEARVAPPCTERLAKRAGINETCLTEDEFVLHYRK